MKITSAEELEAIYGAPKPISIAKEIKRVDRHARAFLARSPFVLIGTTSPGGLPDVSPRGDRAGFAEVLDDKTIAIPDRPGNRRLDSLRNILAEPAVGLLFLIPGMDETLRINGRAEIRTDRELLDMFAVEGRAPLSVLRISIEELYFHCAKAFLRSDLWNPARFMDRGDLPSLGRMISDQMEGATSVSDLDSMVAESRTRLY